MNRYVFGVMLLSFVPGIWGANFLLGQGLQIKIPLSFQDTAHAEPFTLYFGVDRRATYCVDESLGESNLGCVAECWPELYYGVFESPRGEACYGTGILPLDLHPYASHAQVDTYLVMYCAYLPTTVRWPEDLNEFYDSAKVEDVAGGMCFKVNMLTTDSLVVTGGLAGLLDIYTCGPKGSTDNAWDNSSFHRNYVLSQNYPNPFNPRTVIEYDLPKANYVTLKIYDLLGREVKTLLTIRQEPGRHQVSFNAEGLSSGMYFYRIQTPDFVQTKKMVISR